ncbi:GM18912 [Drosophila sechellia]|uniref:GM18912 n=1 Tax=Drosophila sechellia TaxID=7238 RepID=B4I9Q4_DROSE|nr:GM18912 [Drosophila sechellia]
MWPATVTSGGMELDEVELSGQDVNNQRWNHTEWNVAPLRRCGRREMWLLLSLVLLLAIVTLEMRRFLRNMRTIPGPLPLPLLGNAHIFLGLTPAEACLKMGELAERHGDTFGLFLGPSYSVMLFNPRDVERVLGSSQLLTKSQEYSFLGRWLNEGLLVSNGRKWHRRRKIITPAFHFRILEPYVEIFDRQSLRLVGELALRISRGQERINLGEAIHLCTLDAICAIEEHTRNTETSRNMFLVIGAILASALFVGLLLYQLKFKRLIDLISYMPGPPVLPLVGHGHHFIGKPPHEMVKKIFEFMETYSKDQVLKVWLGPELNVLMANPKDVEVVLGTLRFNDKAGEYKALEPWLKEGLLILDQFVEVFEKGSRDLLRNMEQDRLKHGDSGFSLYDWINLCTMDTICETAMGVSINAQSNADSEYVQAVKTISMVLQSGCSTFCTASTLPTC